MKNSKLVKIVLIVIISFAMIIASKNSFAVTSLDPNSLTGTTTTNSAETNNVEANNVLNNSVVNSSINLNNTTNNAVLTTNNTSNYNNTSLPKTGIEDSMPMVVLTVVLGISAVYAYKKIQDYKNI